MLYHLGYILQWGKVEREKKIKRKIERKQKKKYFFKRKKQMEEKREGKKKYEWGTPFFISPNWRVKRRENIYNLL